MHAMYSRTCNLELHILYLKILRDSDFHRFAVTVTPRCGFSYLCSPATERSSSTGTERSNHDSVFSRLENCASLMTQKDILLELLFKFFTFFCKKTPKYIKKIVHWKNGQRGN